MREKPITLLTSCEGVNGAPDGSVGLIRPQCLHLETSCETLLQGAAIPNTVASV